MLVYTFIRLLYRELLHSCKHDITIISIFSKPGRKHFSVYCVWPTVLLVLWFFFVLRLWNKIISTLKNVVHCTEETCSDVSSQFVDLRQENSLKRIFR